MMREVLDAIGYMTFYHKDIATKECAQVIYNILDNIEQAAKAANGSKCEENT